MTDSFICTLCHRGHPITDCTSFDGHDLCVDCLEEHTFICDHCGRRVWNSGNYGDEGVDLCEACFHNCFTVCSDCGRLYPNDQIHYLDDDDDEGYCDNCCGRHENTGGIQSYYYKPTPIFYGEGPRYFGVELEIDGAGELDRNAQTILAIANEMEDHAYIKHDGSLDSGMEIVSHPMSLDYHQHEMPWEGIIRQSLALGYTSHKATTCGLHVHVNRSSLGDTYGLQEDTIARILFFVENHWNELLRFSRRTRKQLDQWAARYGRKDDPKEILDSAKSSNKGRYTCVNLTNDATIEFRIFRGTLKLNTLIATLQLVNRVCDVAFYLSDQQLQEMTWAEFVSGILEEDAPELVTYLKERRLYVNEPVTGSEEV